MPTRSDWETRACLSPRSFEDESDVDRDWNGWSQRDYRAVRYHRWVCGSVRRSSWRCLRLGRRRGRSGTRRSDARDQELWAEHARYFDELVDRGTVVLGGPIEDDDPEVDALSRCKLPTRNICGRVLNADPWEPTHILRIKDVRAWTVWLDGRSERSINPDTSVREDTFAASSGVVAGSEVDRFRSPINRSVIGL